MTNRIVDLLKKHNRYRDNCINLSPSENALSPNAKQALQNDSGSRYYFETAYSHTKGASYTYAGAKYISELLRSCQLTAQKVFNAEYVSVYPISGHVANLGVLFAFTSSGDKIICHSPESGGYPGLDQNKLPKHLGLDVDYFPMREDIPNLIDIPATVQLIDAIKPKLIIFSSAHTLFPPDIKAIADVCNSVKCKIIYDGSHPLGLIAGKKFFDPLNNGADILIGGTQKSFPGPQGAIIATNRYVDEIKEIEHFIIVDNPHFHRIGALSITLCEMEQFGEDYAKQVISNSRSLAKELKGYGLPVLYEEQDFTESHMFKMKIFPDYAKFTAKLEKANIIVDNAGRIGTNEMTRFGMKENEMKEIAYLISCIFNDADPQDILQKVKFLRNNFQDVVYC